MKRFFIVGLTITLTGCNWIYGHRDALIRDRANEYLTAESVPRITLPEGVPSNKDEEDFLPIPALPDEAKKPLPEDFEIPTAPPLLAEDQADVTSLVDLSAFDGAKSAEVGARLIENEKGGVVLQFNKGFDEAWDTVGESLKSTGIKIVDLNRSSATYDIEYDDIPLQLTIEETNGITVVTLLRDKQAAALGLSEEVLQKIIDAIPR